MGTREAYLLARIELERDMWRERFYMLLIDYERLKMQCGHGKAGECHVTPLTRLQEFDGWKEAVREPSSEADASEAEDSSIDESELEESDPSGSEWTSSYMDFEDNLPIAPYKPKQIAHQVVIGSLDLAATHTVTQKIEIMDENNKGNSIMRFMLEVMKPDDKAIIFCDNADRANWLYCELVLKGIKCQAIHENREQLDREQALDDIKDGTVRILIATDVASRGIDIQDVTYVVNFDFPPNIEEYVHRVGRTGRAGRSGTSLSFLTRQDWSSAKELIEILKEANQEVPAELEQIVEQTRTEKFKWIADSAARFMDSKSFRKVQNRIEEMICDLQNLGENPPQNSVKRAVEDNDDWDDDDKVNKNVTSSNQATNDYKKADDWEMDKPSGGPSVNVYTRSTTNDYQKPRDSFNSYNSEKKFKTRNDYYDRPPRPSIFDVQPPYEQKEYVPIDWDKINAEAEEARKARWANCPIMLKNFYEEHPMTKAMTSEEVAKFRFENNKIQVTRGFDDKAETDPDLMRSMDESDHSALIQAAFVCMVDDGEKPSSKPIDWVKRAKNYINSYRYSQIKLLVI